MINILLTVISQNAFYATFQIVYLVKHKIIVLLAKPLMELFTNQIKMESHAFNVIFKIVNHAKVQIPVQPAKIMQM